MQADLPYRPMTLIDLAGHLAGVETTPTAGNSSRSLEEFSHESPAERGALLADEPPDTGDERWNVFLAALAEHLNVACRQGGCRLGRQSATRDILVSLQHRSRER